MKLNPKQKILKAVAKQQDNRFLTNHLLLTDSGELVATDGRVCVVLPKMADDDDTCGTVIDGAVAKEAMRPGHARGEIRVAADGSSSGSGMAAPTPKGEFPSWQSVIPKPSEKDTVITFDPRLLINLIEASGVLGHETPVVTLRISSPRHPMRVDTNAENGAYGVIMPLSPA